MPARLARHGYLHLPGMLDEREVVEASSCFVGPSVRYAALSGWIRDTLLPTAGAAVGWVAPVCTKWRASNNNNSTDAAAMHRDLIPQAGATCAPAVCTVLCYLDGGVLEVVAGSHRRLKQSLPEALASAASTTKVAVCRGDIVIISSLLLHRGVFVGAPSERRLVQVFEVYPSEAAYWSAAPLVRHVPAPGSGIAAGMFAAASRVPGIVDVLNLFGYLNAAMGYGSFQYGPDTFFLSSEAAQRRVSAQATLAENNLYVLERAVADVDLARHAEIRFAIFDAQYLLYLCVSCLAVFIASRFMHP